VNALALELPFVDDGSRTDARPGAADLGGEPTLDALVSGVWEGLAAHRPASCPLCDGEMTPDYGVHALPIGGRCQSCGTHMT
jgi:hypothetical protein